MKYIKKFEFKIISTDNIVGKYIVGKYKGSFVIFKILESYSKFRNRMDVKNYHDLYTDILSSSNIYDIKLNDVDILKVFDNLDDARNEYDSIVEMEKYNI